MAYIARELECKFLKLNDFFKVILVTGARQVGKTTMLADDVCGQCGIFCKCVFHIDIHL